jgi:hypothetical protein
MHFYTYLLNVPFHLFSQGFEIRYAQWAPVGNALAYVDFDNNIYYRRSVSSEDVKLTDNGVANEVG